MLGSSTLKVISTIIGVTFVAYQYFDAKWKSRIERSLEYVILYQTPDKIAARNSTALWPPPENTAEVGALNQELLDILTSGIKPEKYRDILATQVINRFAEKTANDMTNTKSLPNTKAECKDKIDLYVDHYLDTRDEYRRLQSEITSDNGLDTEWGNVQETETGRHYSKTDVVYYYYAWPFLLSKFFYDKKIKSSKENAIK